MGNFYFVSIKILFSKNTLFSTQSIFFVKTHFYVKQSRCKKRTCFCTKNPHFIGQRKHFSLINPQLTTANVKLRHISFFLTGRAAIRNRFHQLCIMLLLFKANICKSNTKSNNRCMDAVMPEE